jgi:hypothetical protein
MATFFERLSRIFRKGSPDGPRPHRAPRRRDPSHVGGSSRKEIEEAPPGRAEELAGHAVERVET